MEDKLDFFGGRDSKRFWRFLNIPKKFEKIEKILKDPIQFRGVPLKKQKRSLAIPEIPKIKKMDEVEYPPSVLFSGIITGF